MSDNAGKNRKKKQRRMMDAMTFSEGTPAKKIKPSCKFRDQWDSEFTFMKRSRLGDSHAFCKCCNCDFSISAREIRRAQVCFCARGTKTCTDDFSIRDEKCHRGRPGHTCRGKNDNAVCQKQHSFLLPRRLQQVCS